MSLVLLGSTSGSVTLQEPAVAGSTVITLPATSGTLLQSGTTVTEAQGGTGTTVGYNGFKNRLINGAMVIDQRNAGASVVVGSGAFPVDRWFSVEDTDGALTAEQVEDVPAGFVNSVKITTTTADSSLTTTQTAQFMQNIEGFNVSDLGFGSASAQTVTLSFWVKSSLTGTMGGSVRNDSANRSYPFSYTISAANTWEQKSITIAGDTSGTWLTNNSIGIRLVFSLGCGPTRLGTAGAWNANNNTGPTGEVPVIGTLNATWYITGVQLEKGSTATSFDYRPYGTELALCQRYYYKASSTSNGVLGFGYNTASNEAAYGVPFPITMRSVPTFTSSAANTFLCQDNANRTPTVVGLQTASVSMASVVFTISGGTAGFGSKLLDGTSANVAFSSEL
jgi:hypothetical protein